jgi:regulator of cell morphogenesis and NO signaling
VKLEGFEMINNAVVPVDWPANKSWSVNEVIQVYPQSIGVFNHLGIDTCCGGDETLDAASVESSLGVDSLLAALQAAVEDVGTSQ